MPFYRGNPADGRFVVTVVEDDGRIRSLDPRRDLRNHSPTGYAWGYSGSGPAQLALAILCDALGDDESTLTPAQQELVLQLLSRGASPAIACAQIGARPAAFFRTRSQDERFRAKLRDVQALLSQNVAAALYKAAIEGSVSAQSLWLKCCPPPDWQPEPAAMTGPATFDEAFDQLTDADLIELARAMDVDLPPEIAGTGHPPRRPNVPERVPPGADPVE